MRRLWRAWMLAWLGALCIAHGAAVGIAQEEAGKGGRVPDDIEAWGGHGGGFGGGGTAAVEGLAAVRLNPARLGSAQSYEIYGAFHWPSYGKNFYQLGVVDGSGPVKAGLLFTAPLKKEFTDPYNSSDAQASTDDKTVGDTGEFEDDVRMRSDALWGTRLLQRFNLGLAHSWSGISLGVNGSYLKGWMRTHRSFVFKQRDGITFGVGIVAEVTPQISVAVSAENLNNNAVKDLAPTFYRGGVSWWILEKLVALNADYVQRQRVRSEWVEVVLREDSDDRGWRSLFENHDELSSYEKRLIISAGMMVQNLMRLSLGYAHEVGSHGLKRRSLAGDVAVLSDIYAFSYQVRWPYLQDDSLHQKVELSLKIEI